MTIEENARIAKDADLKTDIQAVHDKWKRKTHAPLVAPAGAGMHIVDLATDGFNPMSQVAYVTLNGLVMSPMAGLVGDYTLTLDVNGNVTEIVFQVPLEVGDQIAYFGQEAYSLIS